MTQKQAEQQLLHKGKGQEAGPEIYRTPTGAVYGIERFPSPTSKDPLVLRANNKKDAEYQAGIVLEGIEGATVTVPPPMPEPELPDCVKQLGNTTTIVR